MSAFIKMIVDILGFPLFALASNIQFFMFLTYFFLGVAALYRVTSKPGEIYSKQTLRYLTGIFSNFYRITLILFRINLFTMVSKDLCLWKNSLFGIQNRCYNVTYSYVPSTVFDTLYFLFIFEQTNLLGILLNGQKITKKRLIYIICHFFMIACIAFKNMLAFNLLMTNYIVDLVKDITQLILKDKSAVDYIYKFKPVFLALTYMIHIMSYNITFLEIVIPLGVVLLSAQGTLINIQ